MLIRKYTIKINNLIKEKVHYLTTFALISGFIIDNIMLKRIDRLFENSLLIGYLILLGISIAIFHSLDEHKIHTNFTKRILEPSLTIFIPFLFGNVFSGFTIFYSRSGSILSAIPFIGILILITIGSEYYKNHYLRFPVQILLWFLAIFSFLIFYVPILLHSIGVQEFILSGILALIIILSALYVLTFIIPKKINMHRKHVITGILMTYIVVHILYFTNIIPPIPLSLKEAELGYNLMLKKDGYHLSQEYIPWYDPQRYLNPHLHYIPGTTLYAFTAIFAPTRLHTTVYHEWQHRNTKSGKWETKSKIPYQITGGRDNGYRGYTFKKALLSGEWRIRIITGNNQLLGNIPFSLSIGANINLKEKVY